MLRKVLKYDLKYIYKVLLVFYIITITCALLTRLFWSIDNSAIFNVLGYITSGATISFFFSILINNLMRNWARVIKNVYKDESYLTHTLPVSKNTIYLSKFLSSIITVFTSVIIILLAAFIAYYSKENMQVLKTLLQSIASIYNSSVLSFVLIIAIVFFLEITYIIQVGNTGIIIGHKANNNKILLSIISGFIIYTITSLVLLLILFVGGLFFKDIMNLFLTNSVINIDIVKKIMYIAILTYSIVIGLFFLIDIKLFNKGVNVE